MKDSDSWIQSPAAVGVMKRFLESDTLKLQAGDLIDQIKGFLNAQ